MQLFYRMIFLQSEFFLNRIKFFERGYKYLFQINNVISTKKKKKDFVKIMHIFLLKIWLFFEQPCYIWTAMVKHFKKIIRFKISGVLNVNYFKEIKLLKSLQTREVYLEPKRASTMELSILFDGLTHLDCDYMGMRWWKWAASFTWLTRLHVIRNLLANEIYHFPGLTR